jgi:hypothetical protein
MGCFYVAHNWGSGEIKKGHANVGYITQTAPLLGTYWQGTFCSFMHTNAMVNDSKPHPVQEPKTYAEHPSYACNH